MVCTSPNIVRAMNSRRIRWAMLVTRVKICAGFCWGNLRERDQLEDTDVDGMIILK